MAEGEVLQRVEEGLGLLCDFLELLRAVDLSNVLLECLVQSFLQSLYIRCASLEHTGQSVQGSSERSLVGSTVSTGMYW